MSHRPDYLLEKAGIDYPLIGLDDILDPSDYEQPAGPSPEYLLALNTTPDLWEEN